MVQSQTKLTSKNSWAQLSSANSNLDGLTGAYVDVVTGGASGTLIKTIIIKATVSTVQDGMVRLFIKNGSTVTLLLEIPIPIVTKSGRDCAYYNVIPINYKLQKNETLIASTEKANRFNVIAECLNWSYASPAPDFDDIQYSANASGNKISVANSNLDGTGTGLVKIFTANNVITGVAGCEVNSIVIKALGSVTPGMVRLFLKDDSSESTAVLFCEVIVPAMTQTGNDPSFTHEAIAGGSLVLQSGYSIWASTENAENFAVTIDGQDWLYP